MVYYPDLICIPPTRLFLGRNIVGDGRARGDKDRLRDCTSGFGAQMRLERGPVGSLARTYQCSCFVLLLARRRGHDRID